MSPLISKCRSTFVGQHFLNARSNLHWIQNASHACHLLQGWVSELVSLHLHLHYWTSASIFSTKSQFVPWRVSLWRWFEFWLRCCGLCAVHASWMATGFICPKSVGQCILLPGRTHESVGIWLHLHISLRERRSSVSGAQMSSLQDVQNQMSISMVNIPIYKSQFYYGSHRTECHKIWVLIVIHSMQW